MVKIGPAITRSWVLFAERFMVY